MDDIRTDLNSAFNMERDIESGELVDEDDYHYERFELRHAVPFSVVLSVLLFIGLYIDAPGMILLPTQYPID